jgi:hypothetical protein
LKLTPALSPNATIRRKRRTNPGELADGDLGMSARCNFHVYMGYGKRRLFLALPTPAPEQ